MRGFSPCCSPLPQPVPALSSREAEVRVQSQCPCPPHQRVRVEEQEEGPVCPLGPEADPEPPPHRMTLVARGSW